jgi:hypothetical protein
MKRILFLFVAFLSVVSCKKSDQQNSEKSKEITVSYASFGNKISKENMMTSKEMFHKFSNLKNGDTINVKFSSTVNDLCTKKGCWMKLPLTEETETMVRFKDYGFFMPLDAKGKEVIVNGKAFIKETSVAELQHYAEDAGKTKEEIAEITAPKIEFAFEADGVLLKQ